MAEKDQAKEDTQFDIAEVNFAESDYGVDIDRQYFRVEIPSDFGFESRYIKPYLSPEIQEEYLAYENAERLADDLIIGPGCRYYVLVDGSFYFGDFIEALIVRNNWLVRQLTISTLSMNENNVDSLANLLDGGFVEHLDLIVSAYFYSHERNNLVNYLYECLDKESRFQLAVVGSHCKLCLIETAEPAGWKLIMHGSANLRSSSNIEQLMVEENGPLYDFNREAQARMIKRYATINHEIRGKPLWQVVARKPSQRSTPSAEGRRPRGSGRRSGLRDLTQE